MDLSNVVAAWDEACRQLGLVPAAVLRAGAGAAGVAAVVWLAQAAFGRWLTPAWKHRLWWLVVLRAALPVLPASPASLGNVDWRRPVGWLIAPPARWILPPAVPRPQSQMRKVHIPVRPQVRLWQFQPTTHANRSGWSSTWLDRAARLRTSRQPQEFCRECASRRPQHALA